MDPETDDGKQTKIDFAFDLVCPEAMLSLARVLQEGRVKGRTQAGWKSLPVSDHLNHALMHVYAHMAGDRQEDHLQHAMCRMMMAWSVENTLPRRDEEQFKWVYLCYPYKDDPIQRTRKIIDWAWKHYHPHIHFIIPHLMMQYMDEGSQRTSIMGRCRESVLRCDELWVVGGVESEGMMDEITAAEQGGIPIVRKEE